MKILILVITNTILWIANSVSFWQMTVDMPDYQLFLLWFTLIPYILILTPLLFFKRFRNPFKEGALEKNYLKIHLIYILYALFSTGDSLLEMLAGPHLGGIIQAILSAAIPLPTVGLLAYFVLKQHFGKWELVGSFIVLGASALQITASTGIYFTSFWWIVAFAAGLFLGSIYTVLWEIAFTWYSADPFALMIWSTLYSIPIYGITVAIFGLSQPTTWSDQLSGMECFFGRSYNSTYYCSNYAWISATGYSLSSLVSDLVQLYLVSCDTAFFLIIADALSTPLIAIIFALPFFGKDTEPFTWQSMIAVILIVIGMLVYKFPEIRRMWRDRNRSISMEEIIHN